MAKEPDEEDVFSLSRFFSENSSLFTIFGVFGAVSVYFVQFPSAQNTGPSQKQILGFVASLLLFVFVAYSIQKQAVLEMGGVGELINHLTAPRGRSIEFGVFMVLFNMLMGSAAWLMMDLYPDTTLLSVPIIAVFLGIMFVLWLFGKLNRWLILTDDDSEFGRDPKIRRTADRILIYAALIVLTTLTILSVNADMLSALSASGVRLYFSTPAFDIDYVIIGFTVGAFLSGLLVFSLGGSMRFLHWVFKRVIEQGKEEEVKEVWTELYGGTEEDDEEHPPYIQ